MTIRPTSRRHYENPFHFAEPSEDEKRLPFEKEADEFIHSCLVTELNAALKREARACKVSIDTQKVEKLGDEQLLDVFIRREGGAVFEELFIALSLNRMVHLVEETVANGGSKIVPDSYFKALSEKQPEKFRQFIESLLSKAGEKADDNYYLLADTVIGGGLPIPKIRKFVDSLKPKFPHYVAVRLSFSGADDPLCRAFDANHDGLIQVDELAVGVAEAQSLPAEKKGERYQSILSFLRTAIEANRNPLSLLIFFAEAPPDFLKIAAPYFGFTGAEKK